MFECVRLSSMILLMAEPNDFRASIDNRLLNEELIKILKEYSL